MEEKQDESIDSQSGFKFNPIDEGTPLPIARQIHQAGMTITPPEALLSVPEGSGDAPYIFGSEAKFEGKKEQSPGFFETIGKTVWDMSIPKTAWNLGSNFYRDISDHTEVPEGWSPFSNPSYFENVPEKYWSSLAGASSPKRQEQIYQDIVQEMKDDAYYSKGPFAGKLIGGLAGFYGSGANFIKVASLSRYSTTSETVLRNLQSAAPGLTAQAIEMAAVEQLGRAGTDAEEFGVEALQMLAVSGLLHAGGKALGERMHQKRLYDAKDAIHAQNENVSFEPVLNEKGQVVSYEPVANPGKDVSAAEMAAYKEFLDSRINESGLMRSKTMQRFFGNQAFGSTILRMKTSQFNTGSQFVSIIAKNRFLTAGEVKGQASQITASEYHQSMQSNGYQLANRINELYYKAIGLSEKNTFLNKMRSSKQSGESFFISKRDFGIEVRDAIEGDKPSARAEVNEAATEIRAFMHETNKLLGKAMGLKDVAFVTPKNYFDYFPHSFDHEAIKLDQVNAVMNPDGTQSGSKFIDNMVAHLEEQDNKIINILDRHKQFDSSISKKQSLLANKLKSAEKKLTSINDEGALVKEIDSIKNEIKNIELEKKQWWDSVIDEPGNNHLFVDGEFITKETREIGSKWLSEYSTMETLVDVMKKMPKNEKGAIGEQFKKALRDAEDNLFLEKSRLEEAARNGEMPRFLYRLTSNDTIEFINPNRTPELKDHFTSYKEREQFASQKRDRILGLTDSQVKRDLFEGIGSGSTERSNHLKRRDRTIPYYIYNDNGFFSHDISETITNYADSVGKRLGLMQAFNDSGHFKNIEDVSKALNKERADKLFQVGKIKDPAKKEAARKQLEKDFEQQKKDINSIFNAYHGSDGSQAAKGFNKAFGMYANAAFMGGLPISMISDIGQQVMRHGFGNYLATGLVPMIKTMNFHIKGKNSESIKRAAADIGVGLNSLRARVNNSQLNVNGSDSLHMGNWFSRAFQFSGNAAGQITLSNYMTDSLHTVTTMISQSRIMRNMHDFVKKGKLSQREKEYMASLGIDTKQYAQRFVDEFKQHGYKDGKHGYYAEHTQWTDLDAYEVMKNAMYRDVMATHFEGSKFDSPGWSQNQFVKPFFTFQNWAFAAFNNITVPMLQGVDGRKAFGMATLMMLGMLQEPMRAFINGKEYEAPGIKELAAVGLLNSGVLGQFANMINLANTAAGGLFPGFLPQKYKNISPAGALAGIPGTIIDTVAGVGKDLITGKITKQTANKFIKVMPLINSWETRRFSNAIGQQLADNGYVSENSRGASGWAWWEAMNENKD